MSLDDLKMRSAEVEEQCRKAQEQLASVRDSAERIALLEKVRERHLFYTSRGGQVRLPQLAEASPEERVRTYRRLGVRVEADPDGQVRVSGTLFHERLLVHPQNHLETW